MRNEKIQILAALSVFTAASIILARLLGFYIGPSLRVSFEFFPIILAGYCFGPIAGAAVGFISDFLGATVLSGLGFYPPIIVGPVLAGFLSGLAAKYILPDSVKRWKFFAVAIIVDLLCNLLYGSFSLSLLLGRTPFTTLLALRAPLKLGIAVFDAYLVTEIRRAILPLLNGHRPKYIAKRKEGS